MSTTLVLGGGFGGIACARALRGRVGGEHRIVLVDRSPQFVVGASKTWVMTGERTADQVRASRASLLPDGVELVEAEVEAIDPVRRQVKAGGRSLGADHLVIALGARLDLAPVPGLEAAAETFYTLEGAARLRSTLAGSRGGRLVILIPRAPFQCPPAPYEAAMLLHSELERAGVRERTTIEVWTVEKAPMPTAGPEIGEAIMGLLAERGITFHPLKKTASVDASRRAVHFEDGSETTYDLLIAVPPHLPPRVVVEAGLAKPDGWIPVDPETLEVRVPGAAPHVYAVGDVTSVPLPGRWVPDIPLVLPKAGVFAAAQGEAAASRIASALGAGAPPVPFDGRGYCFIEVGGNRAMRGDGAFFQMPHPEMRAQPPDAEKLREKAAWVAGWLNPVR